MKRTVLLLLLSKIIIRRSLLSTFDFSNVSRFISTVRGSERNRIASALLHVYAEPDNQRRGGAQSEEEREAFPVVSSIFNDSLNNIRPNHAGSAVWKPEETEVHVVEAGRREFSHHSLWESVIRCLEKTENYVVSPKLPDIMKSKSLSPYTDHTPQWNEDSYDISHDKHFLRWDLPVPLNVPESKRAYCWRDRLRQAEIRVLQKRKGELVILTNRDQRARCIQPLSNSLWMKIRLNDQETHVG